MRRASGQAISQKIDDHPNFFDFMLFRDGVNFQTYPFWSFSVGIPKDRVYANNHQTNALKNKIQTVIRRVPHEMLNKTIANFNVKAAYEDKTQAYENKILKHFV